MKLQQVKGDSTLLELINPKDGKTTIPAQVHEASESQVDEAVSRAQAAFEGPWGSYTGEQRAVCLQKFADLIMGHIEELAYFESICTGRPISFIKREIPRVASVFRCM